VLCTSSTFVVNPSLYSKITYDPFKDFIPIADLGASPNVIVADPKIGLNSLLDLIARAKANPQLFNYSSAGAGTTPHLSAELLKIRDGPALQGVLSGVVQLAALNLLVALPQINAGTVKALVQTGEKRWVDLPDVPTMEEAGIPNAASETFQALFVRAGTPADIVKQLSDAAVKAASDPNFKSSMVVVGFGITGTGSDELRARVAREVPAWKEVIDKAGIRLG
jgi:tripartite-type tricarboxylate transporter receptor subunit TctC